MHDSQMDMLMQAAQKMFVEELNGKVGEMEKLCNSYKDRCPAAHAQQMIRFFHSISGTASTLGLNHLSSVGKEWEGRLKEIVERGHELDSTVIEGVYAALGTIKRIIDDMRVMNSTSMVSSAGDEYVNMPDRGKILLIDDEAAVLTLLEGAFTQEGYKVYICDDPSSAMDMIAIIRPDIIILDIMMPEISGFEILEKVKAEPRYTDMYVIFLSAKGEADDKIKGIKSGADDYIVKPFTIGEVTARVEMVMRRSGHYRERLLRDSLTGAYSRYYFNQRIAEEFERCKRNNAVLSLAFVDIDHFKCINDRYGHQTGDYVLKELIGRMTANVRKYDSIFRYGGEEFIVLMPDTTAQNAYTVIDRLRAKFAKEPICIEGVKIKATFSAGIRLLSDNSESISKVISDADQAMYYAKKSGRNRVAIYSEELSAQVSKKTLLIVDDENIILKLLRDRLSNKGYNIVVAKDGAGALSLAEELHPDVMILDIILPDIDGFEVCRRIKEKTETSSIKVIMLSKKKEKKSIVKGLHIGADDYLTKPFSMTELEARIMRLLNCSP